MIFSSYTGNAMLNNALMTIEALGKLKNVSEITPALLLDLYKKQDLRAINKRLKNYTMLFSLNNPLVNPAKKQDDAGEKTYHHLLINILNNFEDQGTKICEISGLHFEKSFEDFYGDELGRQKNELRLKKLEAKEEKKQISNLENTDLTLNRSWFPLIGGLGSDAQALPQAKFTIQIHPICIVIMQFLPLASLLYKGGILLVDSSNFEFAKEFIADNVKDLQARIDLVSKTASIENVREYSKGNYLLKAIPILERKEIDDEYSDLNLWSFSNSGTGASCEIDRIPNSLIKKLLKLCKNPNVRFEVQNILGKSESAYSFLESLEDNKEWWLLYPNKFGSGKKATQYEGVSVDFLESYFNVIESPKSTKYARYLAYLVNKYKSKAFEKYLSDTSAWNEREYKSDLYVVLIEATKNGEWNFSHHLQILDDSNEVPIKNHFYKLNKLIHFYYQKKIFDTLLPDIKEELSQTSNICQWLIALIQNDIRQSSIIKDLISNQEYKSVNYQGVFLRNSVDVNIESILYALYDDELRPARFAINEILHLYFLQPGSKESLSYKPLAIPYEYDIALKIQTWVETIQNFSKDYKDYYLFKYNSTKKLEQQINSIPDNTSQFLTWFEEAIEKTNAYLIDKESIKQWTDDLLYNPYGEFSPSLARFIFKFSILKKINEESLLNIN